MILKKFISKKLYKLIGILIINASIDVFKRLRKQFLLFIYLAIIIKAKLIEYEYRKPISKRKFSFINNVIEVAIKNKLVGFMQK